MLSSADSAPEVKQPEPLNVKIAKECQPVNEQCFVIPPAALKELEDNFNTLKKMIVERDNSIKELKEYQSKTCL